MLHKIPDRILKNIAFCPMSGCWHWLGWESGNGYGKVSWQGRDSMAHRVVYEIAIGAIPEGYLLDHLCRIRCCCNPDHLEPVTPLENTLRGEAVLFGSK